MSKYSLVLVLLGALSLLGAFLPGASQEKLIIQYRAHVAEQSLTRAELLSTEVFKIIESHLEDELTSESIALNMDWADSVHGHVDAIWMIMKFAQRKSLEDEHNQLSEIYNALKELATYQKLVESKGFQRPTSDEGFQVMLDECDRLIAAFEESKKGQ